VSSNPGWTDVQTKYYASFKSNTSEKLTRAFFVPSVVHADLLLWDHVQLAPSYNFRLTHVLTGTNSIAITNYRGRIYRKECDQ